MKLTLISVLVASGLFSMQAMAIDGTIDFIGSINDNTCSVAVNDGNANTTIDLGSVQASSLAKANDSAGGATFTLQIQDSDTNGGKCDLTGKTGTVRFLPMSGTAGDKNQYLAVKAGGADQVAIRIIDQNNAVVPMGTDSEIDYDLTKPLTFTADYISLGVATPGRADAKAGFVINYK
ncbi:fimbrial protein [Erwinia sp. Eh17-17]|uniref:fimbrial protein n=1 Tax=Erwinia sp. Eh17-17 TaxID=3080330 RepID=UPI00320A9B67